MDFIIFKQKIKHLTDIIHFSCFIFIFFKQDQGSLIIDGTCQIPDPLYKLIGSIICFYIPLLVMLVTYALTVRLLANQKQNLGTPDWSSNWMGGPGSTPLGIIKSHFIRKSEKKKHTRIYIRFSILHIQNVQIRQTGLNLLKFPETLKLLHILNLICMRASKMTIENFSPLIIIF